MAQAPAKGDVALTIDELGLEASLRFTPDPNGAEWNAEKLMRLVMDARIGGMNQKKAEDLLSKFSRSRGPVTEILARGQAPEEPRGEEAEWSDLVPPAGLDGIVAATIAGAAPPELYKVRIETTRVERKVKKPGALPFLPAKVETVVEQERHEVRERVYPDSEVVKTGFARKGERLCILSTAKPGKAGKSIFGKPIPPQVHESGFPSRRGGRAEQERGRRGHGRRRAGRFPLGRAAPRGPSLLERHALPGRSHLVPRFHSRRSAPARARSRADREGRP